MSQLELIKEFETTIETACLINLAKEAVLFHVKRGKMVDLLSASLDRIKSYYWSININQPCLAVIDWQTNKSAFCSTEDLPIIGRQLIDGEVCFGVFRGNN